MTHGDAGDVGGASLRGLRAAVESIDGAGIPRGVPPEVWASTVDQHSWYVPRNFVVPWGPGPAAPALTEVFRPPDGADTSTKNNAMEPVVERTSSGAHARPGTPVSG